MTRGMSGSIRWERALLQTAIPAREKSSSTEPAISAGRAEKTSSAPLAPLTFVGDTMMFLTFSGKGASSFQFTTSPYFFPALLSEAVRVTRSNQGWLASSWTNRCPTAPVAPSTPTLIMAESVRSGHSINNLLCPPAGKSGLGSGKARRTGTGSNEAWWAEDMDFSRFRRDGRRNESAGKVVEGPAAHSSLMAAEGQTSMQVLHSVHFFLSTFATPPSMVMASAGHSSTQVSHPTQRSDSTCAGILVYVREKRTNRFRYSTLPSGGEKEKGVSLSMFSPPNRGVI